MDWEQGEYWVCPNCKFRNTLDKWPGDEYCVSCNEGHEWDTDYDCGGDDISIVTSYVGPIVK